MPNPTPAQVRRLFLSARPHVGLPTAAELLGVTLRELEWDIGDGVIVAASTALGVRVGREELVAAAIEDALGEEAAEVLPEAIRLVLLSVRVPRYQREVLVALARRAGTSVDEIVRRELEDVACAHAEELAEAVPSLVIGLGMPRRAAGDPGGAGGDVAASRGGLLSVPCTVGVEARAAASHRQRGCAISKFAEKTSATERKLSDLAESVSDPSWRRRPTRLLIQRVR